jgi:hypothetical protein
MLFLSSIRRLPRSTFIRPIGNAKKRYFSRTTNPAQPTIQGFGKVQWKNEKGSRSFGISLDMIPEAPEKPFAKAAEAFPGALSNSELVDKICCTLERTGFDLEKTQVATSLCCDEVNRPLELELSSKLNHNFNMGGLAGFPFGGATSFAAMASHIPDGGSCLVVYGPHVGVDSSGIVGTVERRGRIVGGSCCGSAVAASHYVSSVLSGETEEASVPEDVLDAQQDFVGKMLLPFAEKLENSKDKMVDLPFALYEAQSQLMKRIVNKSAPNVGDDGSIAILGGIQVNTPPGFSDYYCPISFNIYNNQGELQEELW